MQILFQFVRERPNLVQMQDNLLVAPLTNSEIACSEKDRTSHMATSKSGQESHKVPLRHPPAVLEAVVQGI